MMETARKVYAHLNDEISKRLFLERINYSIGGDDLQVWNIPIQYKSLSSDVMLFKEKLDQWNGQIVAFGAGEYGHILVKQFHHVPWKCFIDNYRTEPCDVETGLSIYSLTDYMEQEDSKDTLFVIGVASRENYTQIFRQLLAAGVSDKAVAYCGGDWRNNCAQYFDLFVPREKETFVDCGCFDGSTVFRFAGWCGKQGYEHIWCFEPDEESYIQCKETLSVLEKCEIYPYGISDKHSKVSFSGGGNEDSHILTAEVTGSDVHMIETVALDDILANQRITFIKMDIEGAEFDAIKGAQKIIKEQKPRLAISIYHNYDHIVLIPDLLLSLRPDYHFYIRHYSLIANETILYAE